MSNQDAAAWAEWLAGSDAGRRLLSLPGHVLNSGWDTVAPGEVYVLGLNPGGLPERAPTVDAQLRATPSGPRSAYDECWNCPAGTHPHQRRVKRYLQALGIERPAAVLASNVYFPTTRDAAALVKLARSQFGGLDLLGQACWQVHARLLEMVRPRVLLCLGNSERRSALSAVLARTPARMVRKPNFSNFRAGKFFVADMTHAPERPTLVFGVPHPSRLPATDAVLDALRHEAGLVGLRLG